MAVGNITGGGSTIHYSNNGGIIWFPADNTFITGGLGVAWNGSIWVAVGNDDTSPYTIKWSTDGITWTNASTTLGDGLFSFIGWSIAWNGSMWIAGGSDSAGKTLKYSYDGNVWMNTNYITPTVFTIGWNGYMWVAGKVSSPTIIYSYNGINWFSDTTNSFDTVCNGIAWNGRMWVAAGDDTTWRIKYSYDGINWNNAIGGFNGIGYGVAWNGKMFVAVGQDSVACMKYSYDGINWQNSSSGAFNIRGRNIAWGASVWVAVGQDSANNTIKYSYDGMNWQDKSGGAVELTLGYGIAYSSPLTPDISSRGLNMYLQSQPVFLSSTNQILATLSSIVINNTLYVDKTSNRVGINVPPNANYTLDVNGAARITNLTAPQVNTSSILASTLTSFYTYTNNLQTSSIIASTLTSFYTYTNNLQTSSILASTLQVYGNVNVVSDSQQKLWVAVGQGSPSIRYSSDGIVWNNATGNVFNNSAYGVAWNGSMWVAVGEFSGGSTIRFSYDGIIWNRATVGIFGGYGYGVAWNGRIWVAVGDEGGLTTTIKYSNDGIIWNDVSSTGFTVWGNGIAWNGYMWVAVGQGGSTIRYSYDGLTWSNASSGEFSSFGAGIAWNGAIWVAVGAGGGSTIKYSYDGINWNSGQNVFSISGSGVAWNGSIWVAVGNGGSIKYSRDGIIWYNASSSGDGLFSGYGAGISWNGSLWVAVGFGGGVTIKYSKDGILWKNASGSIFLNEGSAVANNYSVLPDYSAKELNMYLKGHPVFLSSTNQILATSSTIIMNNTLYVDKTTNRVGINISPNANYALDVNGSGRLSNVITPIIDVSESCRVLSELYLGSSNAPQSAVLRFTSLLGGTYIQSGSNLTTGSVAPLFFTGINGSPSWMVLTSNGRLGIGNTNPSYPLDVTGDIRATGVFRGDGSGLTNLPQTINSFVSQPFLAKLDPANAQYFQIFLNTSNLTPGVPYLVTAEISFRRTGNGFDGSFFYFTSTGGLNGLISNLIGIPYVVGYANNVMDLGGAGNPYGSSATSIRSCAQAVVTNGIINLWAYNTADDIWTYTVIVSAVRCSIMGSEITPP